jgi:DNA replication protein DnaC
MTMPECERCRGTGFEIAQVEGADGEQREVARRCACRNPTAGDNADRLHAALRIPPRYEHCTFAEFKIGSTPAAKEARDIALSFCVAYPTRMRSNNNDQGLGLIFSGGTGRGKTHLAVAVLRELAEVHSARGQFWDYHELMREIRSSYDPGTAITEYSLLEPIIELDVLLLDDLGAWKVTDWMTDTLFYILNRRFLARRPTLITTNYYDQEFRRPDADGNAMRREQSVDSLDDRLRSRLLEMCVKVRLDGPDRREDKQRHNQSLL